MMTVKELKKILEQISSDKDDYIVTSDCGFRGFDGEIFIDNDRKEVNIE